MSTEDRQPGWDERYADDRRRGWDDRHRSGDFEGDGPNPTLVAGVAGLRPGTALELAAGSGTNAVWLATQGWSTTAVDWSPVGIANGRAKADAAGVSIEWLERDLFEWSPPARAFDLVVIVYLHVPQHERVPIYAAAAAAVAEGGHIVIVGHDRLHGAEGLGGPDPDRLFTAAEIADEIRSADPATGSRQGRSRPSRAASRTRANRRAARHAPSNLQGVTRWPSRQAQPASTGPACGSRLGPAPATRSSSMTAPATPALVPLRCSWSARSAARAWTSCRFCRRSARK